MKTFEDLYRSFNILMVDTEILKDVFTFQFEFIGCPKTLKYLPKNLKYNPDTMVYTYWCFTDDDIYNFASFFNNNLKRNSVEYFYNKKFDFAIINILLNLVNNRSTDIIMKLRRVANYIIKHQVDYIKIRGAYWHQKLKNDKLPEFSRDIDKQFFREFKACMVDRMKVITLDIPKIASLTVKDKWGNEKPSISLKKLQLIYMDKQLKFDFHKYETYADIVKDGLDGVFQEYCDYDVTSMKILYYKFCEHPVKLRYYAIKAINDANLKELIYKDEVLFSESNTNLIRYLLALPPGEKKNVEFNYLKYIQTNHTIFNNFVNYVDAHQDIKTDQELANSFKDENDRIFNIGSCEVKFGLGGGHGAIPKKTFTDLIHIDYESQYPSIILQYKELFKNIIDVELFEAIYNLRNEYKKLRDQSEEYDNLQNGLKLIINSTTGLINSNYDVGINCKKLGRFVCLKGQSLLYNLCDVVDADPININTDGIFFENFKGDINKVILAVKDRYLKIDSTNYQWMIQNDVNNYLALTDKGKLKPKGSSFNIGLKQQINNTSNLSVNIENAINLIMDKPVIIKPVYFKKMLNLNSDKIYYLTTSDRGKNPIKDLKKPERLVLEGKQIFVTENKNCADIDQYKKFAEITKERILKFKNTSEKTLWYEVELVSDLDSNNKIKRKELTRLKKLLEATKHQIGFCGYNGNIKANTYYSKQPIKPLINYKKTEIQNSTQTQGFTFEANETHIIVDIDLYDKNTKRYKENIDFDLVNSIKDIKTFSSWNNKTRKFQNKKLIFKNDMNKVFKIKEEYSKYFELVHSGVIWSLRDLDRYYSDNNIPVLDFSEHYSKFENMLTVISDDAEKFHEMRKENSIISDDRVTKAAIEILKNHKITIFEISNDSKGVHLATCCPYCQYNQKDHYHRNNTIDAYVNIIGTELGYTLTVHQLSNGCKNEEHKQFTKELREAFKKLAPTKKQYENEQLFEELEERLKKVTYDFSFFRHQMLKIVGTGGGKTYQSALKYLYNLFYTENFSLFSTLQNANLEDFENYIKTIIKEHVKNTTPLIDKWLEEGSITDIFSHKLTSISPISGNIQDLQGIITNHKYFYNLGHIAKYNPNMVRIREEIKRNMEITIDEYESFRNMGNIFLKLFNYKGYGKNIDTGAKIPKKCNSCLFVYADKNNGVDLYTIPERNYFNSIIDTNGILEYNLDLHGQYNLYETLYNNAEKTNNITIDTGKAEKPICIYPKSQLSYMVCYKDTELKLNIVEDGLKNNFKELLKISKQINVTEMFVKVGPTLQNYDNFDINTWGTELSTLESFFEFGQNELTPDQFLSWKKQLSIYYFDELYCEYLNLNVKSLLDSFDKAKKFYLTANKIEDDKLKVNTDLAYLSSKRLKTLNFCLVERSRDITTVIAKFLEYLKPVNFKTLAFMGNKRNIIKFLNKEYGLFEHVQVLRKGSDDVNNAEFTTMGGKINMDNVNCVLSYINSSESQGRNYKDEEIIIIDCKMDYNIKSRRVIDSHGKSRILSYKEAIKLKIVQAIGRILRGEAQNKVVILIGDTKYLEEIIQEYKKYDFDIKIDKADRTFRSIKQRDIYLKKIITYYSAILENSNRNGNLIPIHFNTQTRNNKLYDENTIMKYYDDFNFDYYKIERKQPTKAKAIDFIAAKMELEDKKKIRRILDKHVK